MDIEELTEILTPREIQVSKLVARGLTNKQIGHAVTMSEKMVEQTLNKIYSKTGLTDSQLKPRQALTLLVLKCRLVQLDEV
jgi:DNA-binding NarL/FixJ family response regulator